MERVEKALRALGMKVPVLCMQEFSYIYRIEWMACFWGTIGGANHTNCSR
jgi:hypothetical protein